jgi:glutamate decarboxylase
VLRIVVRNGFTHDLADLLLADLRTELPRLARQPNPQRGTESSSFSHGASHPHHTTTPHHTDGMVIEVPVKRLDTGP